jgi:FKBP-type peptidyl-prolyl cis-trans isomerase 2
MSVNGTIYDTSNATLAKQAGIFDPNRNYTPIDFDVLYNNGIITGMINSIIGMHVNETETFDVPPDQGYGPYDPSKVIVVPRYYNMSLYENVPLTYFQQHNINNITNGTSFNTPYGQIFISDINSVNATIFYYGLSSPGASFTYNNVPQQVVFVDTNVTYATIEEMLDVNKSYYLPDPATGAPTYFMVTNKTNTNITIDGNSPFANDTLRFQVTVEKLLHNNQTIG